MQVIKQEIKERRGKTFINVTVQYLLNLNEIRLSTYIYKYLHVSTTFADMILWLSSLFPTLQLSRKKSVCIIFERNNKYNNFIKRLTKALALISLQITNNSENSEITVAKQQSTSESHFQLTNNKHKAILHQPF